MGCMAQPPRGAWASGPPGRFAAHLPKPPEAGFKSTIHLPSVRNLQFKLFYH